MEEQRPTENEMAAIHQVSLQTMRLPQCAPTSEDPLGTESGQGQM